MLNKVKYIVFILLMFLLFNTDTKSLTYGGCEYTEIAKLKKLVSNINLSYDYKITDNVAVFSVTLNNIVPGIYFVDTTTDKTYTYNNTNNGEITIGGYRVKNGRYKFYSANGNCYGLKLGDKYYTLPTYNSNYTTDLCKKNSGYNLCQKWVDKDYTYTELHRKIKEYNEEKNKVVEENNDIVYEKTLLNKIIDFYIKYYYIILIGIILVCVIVMVINKKKNSFKL